MSTRITHCLFVLQILYAYGFSSDCSVDGIEQADFQERLALAHVSKTLDDLCINPTTSNRFLDNIRLLSDVIEVCSHNPLDERSIWQVWCQNPARYWNADYVSAWIGQSSQLSVYADKFVQHSITGQMLLGLLIPDSELLDHLISPEQTADRFDFMLQSLRLLLAGHLPAVTTQSTDSSNEQSSRQHILSSSHLTTSLKFLLSQWHQLSLLTGRLLTSLAALGGLSVLFLLARRWRAKTDVKSSTDESVEPSDELIEPLLLRAELFLEDLSAFQKQFLNETYDPSHPPASEFLNGVGQDRRVACHKLLSLLRVSFALEHEHLAKSFADLHSTAKSNESTSADTSHSHINFRELQLLGCSLHECLVRWQSITGHLATLAIDLKTIEQPDCPKDDDRQLGQDERSSTSSSSTASVSDKENECPTSPVFVNPPSTSGCKDDKNDVVEQETRAEVTMNVLQHVDANLGLHTPPSTDYNKPIIPPSSLKHSKIPVLTNPNRLSLSSHLLGYGDYSEKEKAGDECSSLLIESRHHEPIAEN